MRKTKEVVSDWGDPVPEGQQPLPGQNRDHGKRFLITEMSAYQAERWATRATLALSNRLARELPTETAEELQANPTMPRIGQIMRILGGISFPEMEPLLDEIMACCQIVEPVVTRPITEFDVEEVQTIWMLRSEALALHINFTLAASILDLLAAMSSRSILEDMLISPPRSDSSSPAVSPN